MDSVSTVIGVAAGALIGFGGAIAWDLHRDYCSVLFEVPVFAWLFLMSTAAVGGLIGAFV